MQPYRVEFLAKRRRTLLPCAVGKCPMSQEKDHQRCKEHVGTRINRQVCSQLSSLDARPQITCKTTGTLLDNALQRFMHLGVGLSSAKENRGDGSLIPQCL